MKARLLAFGKGAIVTIGVRRWQLGCFSSSTVSTSCISGERSALVSATGTRWPVLKNCT